MEWVSIFRFFCSSLADAPTLKREGGDDDKSVFNGSSSSFAFTLLFFFAFSESKLFGGGGNGKWKMDKKGEEEEGGVSRTILLASTCRVCHMKGREKQTRRRKTFSISRLFLVASIFFVAASDFFPSSQEFLVGCFFFLLKRQVRCCKKYFPRFSRI